MVDPPKSHEGEPSYALPVVGLLLMALGVAAAVLGYLGMYPIAIAGGIVILATTGYIWRREGASLLLGWLVLLACAALALGVLGYFVVL